MVWYVLTSIQENIVPASTWDISDRLCFHFGAEILYEFTKFSAGNATSIFKTDKDSTFIRNVVTLLPVYMMS